MSIVVCKCHLPQCVQNVDRKVLAVADMRDEETTSLCLLAEEEQFVPLVSQADIAAQVGNLPGSVGSVGRIIKCKHVIVADNEFSS